MNVFLLSAIRSGSTYLMHLLEDTGLFHYPEPHDPHPSLLPQAKIREFLAPNPNIDIWETRGVSKDKSLTIEQFKTKCSFIHREPCLFKILREQYRHYMFDDMEDKEMIKSIIPGLRYIWLERQDIVARTVSAYIFFYSGTDHIYDQKSYDEYMDKAVHIDENGLLDVYKNHVLRCDWSKFLDGENYLKVNYEELVARPQETLENCLDFLGYDSRSFDTRKIAESHSKFKTERPESEEWKRRLKNLLRKGIL